MGKQKGVLLSTPKMLLLEQPVDFARGTVETTVAGFDVVSCKTSHHEDSLG